MQLFFNPTIEVVTFCLCGRCMLGMFLLPAFTPLGQECQDLLSLCKGIKEWTGLEWNIILQKAENHKEWRKLVVKSTVVPQWSARLWDR